MWDALRISMFCDMNDMFPEDLDTSPKSPDDVTDRPASKVQVTVSEPSEIPSETERDTHASCNSTAQQQEMTSCNEVEGNSYLIGKAVVNFYRTNRQFAKVDLSTFNHIHPDLVVNDYLTPIVDKTDIEHKPVKKSETVIHKFEVIDKGHVFIRPPYYSKALGCAAFVIAGKTVMARAEIYKIIGEMFEIYKVDDPKWKRLWRRYVVNRKSQYDRQLFKPVGKTDIAINYALVDPSIFSKMNSRYKGENTDTFADNLFDEIGAPEKYKELIIRVAKAKEAIVTAYEQTMLQESMYELHTKRDSLVMPERPCFQDDSSSDSVHLNMGY